MLDLYLQPRYWSSCQPYATCDVIVGMLAQHWQVVSVEPVLGQNHARLYAVDLHRDRNDLNLLVLDGPVMQGIAMKFAPASLAAETAEGAKKSREVSTSSRISGVS